jgi:hypothetical protein
MDLLLVGPGDCVCGICYAFGGTVFDPPAPAACFPGARPLSPAIEAELFQPRPETREVVAAVFAAPRMGAQPDFQFHERARPILFFGPDVEIHP